MKTDQIPWSITLCLKTENHSVCSRERITVKAFESAVISQGNTICSQTIQAESKLRFCKEPEFPESCFKQSREIIEPGRDNSFFAI